MGGLWEAESRVETSWEVGEINVIINFESAQHLTGTKKNF